jgi:nitrate/nitrite transport system permease protein
VSAARKSIQVLETLGLPIFVPVVRLIARESPREQFKQLGILLGVPVLAFFAFLLLWSAVAQTIVTKYGTLPAPAQVWTEAGNLLSAHAHTQAERRRFAEARAAEVAALSEHAARFREQAAKATGAEQQELLKKAGMLEARAGQAMDKRYSGSPTYIDQILTSLKTVFTGFVIASLIAIPLGILCGLSTVIQAALTPLIQIFKPVSPLAWLPIVMIVVGAVYTTDPREAWFEKSFISSAFTVALCSLWPTLVNTALGVASIDKDHLNVARVLKLGWWTRVRKIVLPSSLPLMFAGLRISLGVGWMVLIAAEMLAQNPGLGKFVWDMFQNGSSQTLAQIMVAVFTIGGIGFLLDRVMIALQRSVSYEAVT